MLVSPTMIGKSISEDDIGFGYTDFGRETGVEGCDLSKDISTIIPEHELDNSVGLGRTLGGRPIYQKLTTVNYTANSNKKNLYIVIHYTGAAGTAANNANYFYNTYRGASANYFVDPTSIYQVVADWNTAWHCGGGKQTNKGGTYYKKCLNSNSIGIELCCYISNGKFYFAKETIDAAVDLTRTLMKQYGISVNNVIRHYDVVGKICPEPFVRDEAAWSAFKARLVGADPKPEPHWAEEFYNYLYSRNVITSPDTWKNYNAFVTKSLVVALTDKVTGGTWTSNETNASIHWCQPHIISMAGKGYVSDVNTWLNRPDAYISKAYLMALFVKMTGGLDVKGSYSHWVAPYLDCLNKRGIIEDRAAWENHYEDAVTIGTFEALLAKTIKSGKIK